MRRNVVAVGSANSSNQLRSTLRTLHAVAGLGRTFASHPVAQRDRLPTRLGQAQQSTCRSRLHDADCLRSHRQEQPSLKNCFIGSGLNGLSVLSQLTTVF